MHCRRSRQLGKADGKIIGKDKTMEYIKLGNTGLDVSPVCLGCMSFGTAEGWVHNEWALDEEGSRSISFTFGHLTTFECSLHKQR
jgi:hypothetical protein